MSTILQELASIKSQLSEMRAFTRDVMDAKTAAAFLGMSKRTFDEITRPGNMLIKASKPGGNVKLFLKKDLIDYVENYKSK